MLIVIEGLDGSGKSTQVAKVSEYIRVRLGRELEYLHFPRYDAAVSGEMISRYLRGEYGSIDQVHPQIVALLFALDRRDAADRIRAWIAEGKVVLLDRYVYSNIAFQCSKLKDKAEVAALDAWILRTEYEHFGIPRPDLNIFLDVPLAFVEERLEKAREGQDRDYLQGAQDIHEADMSFQASVRACYLSLCQRDPDFKRVDCSGRGALVPTPDEIFERLRVHLDACLMPEAGMEKIQQDSRVGEA